jgi:hypothetical protein
LQKRKGKEKKKKTTSVMWCSAKHITEVHDIHLLLTDNANVDRFLKVFSSFSTVCLQTLERKQFVGSEGIVSIKALNQEYTWSVGKQYGILGS